MLSYTVNSKESVNTLEISDLQSWPMRMATGESERLHWKMASSCNQGPVSPHWFTYQDQAGDKPKFSNFYIINKLLPKDSISSRIPLNVYIDKSASTCKPNHIHICTEVKTEIRIIPE